MSVASHRCAHLFVSPAQRLNLAALEAEVASIAPAVKVPAIAVPHFAMPKGLARPKTASAVLDAVVAAEPKKKPAVPALQLGALVAASAAAASDKDKENKPKRSARGVGGAPLLSKELMPPPAPLTARELREKDKDKDKEMFGPAGVLPKYAGELTGRPSSALSRQSVGPPQSARNAWR